MWDTWSTPSSRLKVVGGGRLADGGGGDVCVSGDRQRQRARDISPRQHLCGQHEAGVFMVLWLQSQFSSSRSVSHSWLIHQDGGRIHSKLGFSSQETMPRICPCIQARDLELGEGATCRRGILDNSQAHKALGYPPYLTLFMCWPCDNAVNQLSSPSPLTEEKPGDPTTCPGPQKTVSGLSS